MPEKWWIQHYVGVGEHGYRLDAAKDYPVAGPIEGVERIREVYGDAFVRDNWMYFNGDGVMIAWRRDDYGITLVSNTYREFPGEMENDT